MIEEEIRQGLINVGYTDQQIEEVLKEELTQAMFEQLIEAKEEQTYCDKTGNVRFKNVNHSKRAVKKFERISDGNTTVYMNIALKYFGNRCALSGEKFESYENGKIQNSVAKSNLSAEHVIALCQGGDDIYPNLVPTILQYNLSKNGYYLLDWWKKQKDSSGKEIYSPYRLLKLVNYMLKSLEARKQKLNTMEYEKFILTPNEIDNFLNIIEKQDEQETDNNKKKILSDVVTTTEFDEDGKKILQIIPEIEGNIPKQSEQQREKNDEIKMMDIFLLDAITTLKETKELSEQKEYTQLIGILDEMYKEVVETVPFEVEVRNIILSKLKELGVNENIYTVANELLKNTDILNNSNDNKEIIKINIEKFFSKNMQRLVEDLQLTDEQIKIAITNIPSILYDSTIIETARFYKKISLNYLNNFLKGDNDKVEINKFVRVLAFLNNEGLDLSKIKVSDSLIQYLDCNCQSEERKKEIITYLHNYVDLNINEEWNIGSRAISYYSKDAFFEEFLKTIFIDNDKQIKNGYVTYFTKNKNDKSSSLDILVEVLNYLEQQGLDISNIKQRDNLIEYLNQYIPNEEKRKDILKHLHDYVDIEINEEYTIGMQIADGTKKEYIDIFKEKLEKKFIDDEDKIKTGYVTYFTKNKKDKSSSLDTLVEVLNYLEQQGLDISNIKQRDNLIMFLNQNIQSEEKKKAILKYLHDYVDIEIDELWKIGSRISNTKNLDKEQLISRLNGKNAGTEKKERITSTFIKICERLVSEGVDFKTIKFSYQIEGKNIKKTLKDIQAEYPEINVGLIAKQCGVDLDYNIGEQQSIIKKYIKDKNNITDDEIECLKKIGFIKTSKNEELILLCEEIKQQGFSFENFECTYKKNGKQEYKTIMDIKNEFQDLDINKIREKFGIEGDYKIGSKISELKRERNIKKLKKSQKERIEKLGIYGDKYKKDFEDFINICDTLVRNGIQLNRFNYCYVEKGKTIYKTVRDIINECSYININELDESIDLDYEIGYKRKKLLEKMDSLSDEDREIIQSLKIFDKRTSVQELICVCKSLTKQGYTFSNFKIAKSIRIDGKDKRIYTSLNDLKIEYPFLDIEAVIKETGVNYDYPIGRKIKSAKDGLKNMGEKQGTGVTPINSNEAEELYEMGVFRKISSQDIGKASYTASTQGCDEKELFLKKLEKTIEDREKSS